MFNLRPTHPGEVLRVAFLQAYNMTQQTLADLSGMSAAQISALVTGKAPINAMRAIQLAHALNTTPEFWMNLQMAEDLQTAYEKLNRRVVYVRM
jgi:addiction module HigA family antidote